MRAPALDRSSPLFDTLLIFAVATVLIRIALTAPHAVDSGLGVSGKLFRFALTSPYNLAAPVLHEHEAAEAH